MRINFFGDFVTPPKCNNLLFSDRLEQLIRSTDVNVLNYEAPALPYGQPLPEAIKKSGPSLYQDSHMPVWLEEHGFTHAALANNHVMDFGEAGLESTIRSFRNIKTLGAGTWEEAYSPCVIHCGDQKIAILSLTQCEFGTLTDRWDKRFNKGTAWINHPVVNSVITETLKQVDHLFIFALASNSDVLPSSR